MQVMLYVEEVNSQIGVWLKLTLSVNTEKSERRFLSCDSLLPVATRKVAFSSLQQHAGLWLLFNVLLVLLLSSMSFTRFYTKDEPETQQE